MIGISNKSEEIPELPPSCIKFLQVTACTARDPFCPVPPRFILYTSREKKKKN